MSYCWNCRNYSFCRTTPYPEGGCENKQKVRVVSKYADTLDYQVLSTHIENQSDYFWNYHEIEVLFTMSNNKIVFMGGREANRKGDWFWNSNDVLLFECEHPGLLKSIETDIVNNNIRYIV